MARLGFTGPVAGGCRHQPVIGFASFGVFVSRLAPLSVSLIPYPDRYEVAWTQWKKNTAVTRDALGTVKQQDASKKLD